MDCLFCKIIKGEIPSKILYEDDKAVAFMDINPICDGHVLIVPKMHVDNIFDAPDEITTHLYHVAKEISFKIMNKLNEKGVSLSINYGDKQEIKHLHLHILPNYRKKAQMTYEEVYELLMKED